MNVLHFPLKKEYLETTAYPFKVCKISFSPTIKSIFLQRHMTSGQGRIPTPIWLRQLWLTSIAG